jgi:hypothetical protein
MNLMHVYKILIASISSFLFVACATQQYDKTNFVDVSHKDIGISSKFNTIDLTKENFGAKARACEPSLFTDEVSLNKVIENFPSNLVVNHSNYKLSRIFITFNTTGLCIDKSSKGFPILAAEVLLNTANPLGIPIEVEDEWNKQIVLLLAAKGSAKVAYVFKSGNAFIVTFSVSDFATAVRTPFSLNYSTSLKKAGEWEDATYDSKFGHPSLIEISISNTGNLNQTDTGYLGKKTNPLSR